MHSRKKIQELDQFTNCYNHFRSALSYKVGCWSLEEDCFSFFEERASELKSSHHFKNSQGIEKSCKKVLAEAENLNSELILLRDESEQNGVCRCLVAANEMLSTLEEFPKKWPSNSAKEMSHLRRFMDGYIKFIKNSDLDCTELKFDVTKVA